MRQTIRDWKVRYKNSKFSSRLFSWLIILSVAGALSFNFQWNYTLILIGTASLLAAIEILIFRPYFLSAAVVTLAFWMSFVLYMSNFIQGLTFFYSQNQLAYIETIMYAGVVLSTVLILSSNWYIANGRFWFNLTVSYILYFVSLLFIPMTSINPIYVPIISLIPVAIWVAVRKLWLYRDEYAVDLDKLPAYKNETAFYKNLERIFPDAHLMKEDRVVTVYNKKNILLFIPVTPQTSLELTYKGITMDDEDITFVMSHLTNKLSVMSKAAKINGRKFFPVVYITNNKMARGITPVSYRSRKRPDVVGGTVFFVNKSDLTKFMNEVTLNAPKLSDKDQARYENLFMKKPTLTENGKS